MQVKWISWELIIGGAKELANQFYKQQQGLFLEYIGVEAQSIIGL